MSISDREIKRCRERVIHLQKQRSRLLFDLQRRGGAGSGNFGHAGRPGEVGGSSGAGESSEDSNAKNNHTYADVLATPPKAGYKINKEALKDYDSAETEFRRAIKTQYPNGVPCYHETTINNLDSILENGLVSAKGDADEGYVDNTTFATVGKPGGFIIVPDKVVVEFVVSDTDRLVPDMGYNPDNPFSDLLEQHQGLFGADVAYNKLVPLRDIKSISVVKNNRLEEVIKPPFNDR